MEQPSSELAPIKVLMLIKGLGAGGAEQLLLSTAQQLDRGRYQLSVAYVLSWKVALVERLEASGVRTTCLGAADGRDPRWVFRLWKLLRRERYDLIHVHSPVLAAVVRIVARFVPDRPPIVSTDHNTWASHTRPTRWANRITFPLNEAHIAVSRRVAESMPPKLRGRTEVIVQGVDLAAIDAVRAERETIREELGLAADAIAVCTVANLRWQKGYPDLLEAAKAVASEHPNVVFLAVGQGPLEEELRRRHAELGLGDQFRFLGYRDDAIRVLAASDVFALASLHEGYPIAIMEALACGLPVVATDAGGVPDAIRNGQEGFVVPTQRPELLAGALLDVVRDAGLRGRMGAAALDRAALFSLDTAVRRTEEIYRSVIERRPRRAAA